MIVFDASQQGSEEWLKARKGKITGSMFKIARERLKNGEFSAKAKLYARNVARERVGGACETVFQTKAMAFGKEQENHAIRAYETTTGYICQEVGFAATDCGLFGLSVDRLVDNDGAVEVKTIVGSDNLFNTVIDGNCSEYIDQCLGYLLFLDIEWVDLVFWTPDLEHIGLGLCIRRIIKSENLEEIEKLRKDLRDFSELVIKYENQINEKSANNILLLNDLYGNSL